MLAPLLYMLALAGIGASVMFSGYSQILRSNAEMTAINVVRSQLQSAGQTLSATAVLDQATSSIVEPPAVYAYGSVTGGDTARLPTNYDHAADSGSPHDVGVIDVSTGVRQLDPWGKFYVYCRWENAVSSPASPSIMVLSAGPDGSLSTKCGDTSAQGDDRIISSTVAETINRANVWQVSSSSQVKFGIDSNAVRVNQDGSLAAASITLTEPAAGVATLLTIKDKNSNTVFTVSNAGVVTAGSYSANSGTLGSLAVTGNATVGGTLGVTGATTLGVLTAGATALDSLTLTTPLAVAQGGTGAVTAAAARTNLGSTTVGDAVFIAASAGAGRTALGSSATGDALFTAASAAAARATLGSTTVGDALFITASAAAARTTLGLGTMAVQNANAVAITGGTITGVDLTGSSGGTAGSVSASNVTGCCVAVASGGTGSGTAAGARANLGADNASNITSGVFDTTLLPNSGVTAGTYTWGTVNAKGLVTAANDVATSAITKGDSGVAVTDTGSDGAVTITTDGAVVMTIDHSGNVGIGTASPAQKLDVNGNMQIRGAAASSRALYYTTAGSKRWDLSANATAEGGSNAGSDFVINSYKDDGTALATPLTITRSTGNATFAGSVTATGGFVGNLTGNVVGNVTGNLTGNVSGSISLSDGTAASPGLYFTNDTNTGFYRPGADVVGVSAGGNDVARFTGNTSGVNYFNFGASIAGSPLTVTAAGTDTDIGITLTPKGAGTVAVSGPLSVSGNAAFDTNTLYVDASGNKVGIGTATATGTLHVYAPSTASASNVYQAYVEGAQSVANSGNLYGLYVNPTYTASSGNTLAALFGFQSNPQNTSSGTVTSMSGVQVTPQNTSSGTVTTMTAVNGQARNTSSGAVTNMYALQGLPQNTNSGTVGAMYGLSATPQKTGTGAVTTMYGVYSRCDNANATGAVTNCYGLYLDTPTTTGAITNKFGVYQTDSASTNYLAGNIGIGTTTPSTIIGIGGDAARTVGMERGTVAATAGYNFTMQAGGATSGSTDKAGGDLVLSSGTATGAGASNVTFKTHPAGSTGTTDTTATTAMTILGSGYVGIGTTSPATSLYVSGTGIGLDNNTYIQQRGGGGALNNIIGMDNNNNLNILNKTGATAPNGALVFGTGSSGTESMRITSAGLAGIGTATPAATALLDLTSTSLGFLMPRLTTAQRDAISSPATGLMVYNTTTNLINIYNGSAWSVAGNDGTTAFSFPAGSVGSPGLYVTGDTDTGLYQATANTMSVTAGGVEVERWNTVASGVNYTNVTASATGNPVKIGAAGSDTDVGIKLAPKGAGSVSIGADGTAAQTISMDRNTTAATAGKDFTIQGSGATSGTTDKNGGNLVLSSGASTGTGVSAVQFNVPAAGSTGTTDNASAGVLAVSSAGVSPRNATADTAGLSATIQAGGATSGSTDKNGGDLILSSGTATGTGTSNITFKTNPAGSTGATDTTATTAMTILGSGYVGIGTATPTWKLHVQGATTALALIESTGSNYAQLGINNAGGGNQSRITFYDAGTGKWIVGKQTDNSFFMYDVANTRDFLRVSSGNVTLAPVGGNVGIGTTTANHKLDVNGNIGMAASSYINWGATDGASGYGIRDNSGNIELKNSGGSWGSVVSVGGGTTSAFSFPAGSVGAPGLYVTGDSNTGFYQATADTVSAAAGGVEVERWNTAASAVNYLSITPSATGAAVQVAPAGSDTDISLAIMPKGAGGVGIGTASPAAVLHTYGTVLPVFQSTTTGTTRLGIVVPDAVSNLARLAFSNSTTLTSSNNVFAAIDANIAGTGGTLTGDLRFLTNSGNALNERMRIGATGNVGIGNTPSTQAALEVKGLSASGAQLKLLQDNHSDDGWIFNADGPNGGHLFVQRRTGAATSTKFTIQSGGNVGIGTTAPSYLLDVVNAASIGNTIRLAETSAGASAINSVEVISARADGNQTFESRLALAHRRTDGTAIAATSALGGVMFGGQWGTDTSFQSSKLLYPASIKAMAEGNFTSASAMPTGLAFFTGSTGDDLRSANLGYGAERMRIDSSGNVGIGTATPVAVLEVSGANAGNINRGGIRIDDRGDGCCSQLVQSDNGLSTHFYTYNSGDFQIHKYGSGSPAGAVLTILNGGNVGIGTTSPATLLTVAGISAYNTGALFTGSGTLGAGIGLEATGSGGHKYYLVSAGSGNIGTGGQFFIYDSTAGAFRMVIDTSGNFGIGTTSPGAILHAVKTSAGAETTGLAVANNGGTANTAVNIDIDPTGAGVGVRSVQIAGVTNGSNQTSMIFRTSNAGSPAERMRIDSAGLVGIATNAPGYNLDVNGTFHVSGMTTLSGGVTYVGTMTATNFVPTGSSAPANGMYLPAANTVGFAANSTGMLYVTSAGVGVGTAAPAAKLQVTGLGGSGAATIAAATSDWWGITLPDSGYEGSSAGQGQYIIGRGGSQGERRMTVHVPNYATYSSTGQRPSFSVDSSGAIDLMRVYADTGDTYIKGNVGIGTASPAQKLDVNGSMQLGANSYLYTSSGFLALAPASRAINLYDSTNAYNLYIYNGQAQAISLQGNGVSFFNGGNVGIGTTAPVGALDVVNTAENGIRGLSSLEYGSSTAYSAALNLYRARGTQASPTAVQSGDAIGNVVYRGYDGTTGWSTSLGGQAAQIIGYAAENWSASAHGGYLTFWTTPTGSTTVTERMRIDAAGNVGIGTTSPSAVLHVTTGANSDPLIVENSLSTFTNDLARIDMTAKGDNSNYNLLSVYNTSGSGLVVRGDRNVGIGTASPSQLLHVYGGTVRIDNTSGEGLYLYRAGGNANDIRMFTSNGTIASPTASASGNNAGQIHFEGYDGSAYQSFGAIFGYIDGAVSAGTLPTALRFMTGTTARTERMRIDSSGNVGIGTISPAGTLDVANMFYTPSAGVLSVRPQDGALEGGQIQLEGASTYATYIFDNYAGNPRLFSAASLASDKQLQIFNSGGGAGKVGMWVEGNVGIGSTTPGVKLDVVGGIRATQEIISTLGGGSYGGFRNIGGNYGVIERNDGSNFYFLITASGDQYGGWNALRPFAFNMGTGLVSMNNGVAVTNGLTTDTLTVNSTTTYNGIVASSGANAGFQANDRSTSGAGVFYRTGGINRLWDSSGGDAIVYDAAGYVGINGSAVRAARLNIYNGNVDHGDLEMQSGNTAYGWAFDTYDYGGGVVPLKIWEKAAGVYTERMRINSGGNVGIGTTGPGSLLTVNGALANPPTTGATRTGMMLFTNPGDTGMASIGMRGGGAGFWIQSHDSTQSTQYPLLLNPSGGNVGIGTASPGSKLHVVDGDGTMTYADSPGLQVFNAEGTTGSVRVGSAWGKPGIYSGTALYLFSDGANPVYIGNANSEKVTVATSGNVGIATTSPTEKLQVNGVIRSQITNQQGLIALGNADNGAGYYDTGIYRGGIGTRADDNYLNLAGYGGIAFTSSTAAMGSQTLRMYIQGSNGNVGIATTSPAAKLEVFDSAPTSAQAVNSKAMMLVSTNGNAFLEFRSTADNNSYQGLLFADNNQGGYVAFNNAGGGDDYLHLGGYTGVKLEYGSQDSTTNIALKTLGATLNSNGSVGIGNSGAPNGKLDVATNGTNDGIVMYQAVDNQSSIQSYIDGHWSDRVTYASGCCNNLYINTDVGTVTIGNAAGAVIFPGPTTFTGLASFNSALSMAGTLTLTGSTNLTIENQSGFRRIAFTKLTFWDWDTGGDMVTFDNGNVTMTGNVYAPIIYDNNDAGYYVDPNGTSRMSTVSASAIAMNGGTVTGLPGGTGVGAVSTGWYMDASNLAVRPPSGGDTYFQTPGGAATYMRVGTASGGVAITAATSITSGGLTINDRGDGCCSQLVQSDNGLSTHFYTYSSGDFQIHKYGSGSASGAVMTINNAGKMGVNTAPTGYSLTGVDIYANGGWLRSSGNTGWYNETYGGGWYMTDSTYLRAYNGKYIYTPGEMQADGAMRSAIFIDQNDAGYYVDPNGTSNMATIAVNRNYIYLAGAGDTNHAIHNVSGSDGEQFRFWNFLDLYQANGGASRLYIDGSGNVGIGTTSIAQKLDVNGNILARNQFYDYTSNPTGGNSLCRNGSTGMHSECSSDRRLKTNIAAIDTPMLDKVLQLRPVEFNWKAQPDINRQAGFIAQDVKALFPLTVGGDEQKQMLTFTPGNLVPYLVKALKELKADNDNLRSLVAKQGNEIEEFRREIRAH